MNDVTAAINMPTMTSLELVEFINEHRRACADVLGLPFPSRGFAQLEHKDFLEKVPSVLGDRSAEFSADLPDSYGRPRRGYRFPKREACLMAMSYSYELQAAVYDRMTALEQPVIKVPQTKSEALRLAAEQAELIERQEAALALAAPKVAFVEQYVEGTGLKGFRQVCKLLGANENEFRLFLADAHVWYRLGGEWVPYAEHIAAGRFHVKTGQAGNGHNFNAAKFTPKGIEWIAGKWAAYKLQGAA